MKNPQVHICMPGLALSSILQVCILLIHSIHYGSTQNVTCQQYGEAVLSFHFPFISGAEDLHVSLIKMESIDGDTKPLVICTWYKGAVEYYADQYRDRAEIRNDLPSGKLDLILKDVEESDAGIYKCQAANKKNHGEKMIQLYVEIKERSTNTVTCQQHGEAVLSFHFSFISGPEDLNVTIMKMESIDGETKPTVIYVIDKGAVEYHAAHYRTRTEIRNDLSSGKLELILKHVEVSDAGIYKCQAANKKNREDKVIQLYVEIKERASQNVTCQQHEAASLPFHFSFISGPEDLHVSVMKMETIDGDTEPAVICALKQGVPVYHAAQYRDRTEIRNDLPSGKLELILKHVEESDAGIYKCQAANKKNHGEKMIQLYVKQKIIDTSNAEDWPIGTGVISVITCVVLPVCITVIIITICRRVWVLYFTRNRNKDNLKSPLPVPYEMVNINNLQENPMPHKEPQYQKDPTGYAEAGML